MSVVNLSGALSKIKGDASLFYFYPPLLYTRNPAIITTIKTADPTTHATIANPCDGVKFKEYMLKHSET